MLSMTMTRRAMSVRPYCEFIAVQDLLHAALQQGLTLVHVSAERKRFLWDKGCLGGV
jgi:hypothetical protein